jgi:hypothetical protein
MPYDNWLQALLPHFKEAFSDALRELLQEKNLCQSVSINLNFIKTWAFERDEGRDRELYQMRADRSLNPEMDLNFGAQILNASWYPEGCAYSGEPHLIPGSRTQHAQAFSFSLPQLKMTCTECQERALFKADLPRCRFVPGKDASDEQSLLLSYECQVCRTRRVRFFVSRKGDRMQLSGRDALVILSVPRSVPSAVVHYFSDAQIAHRSGQNLAAFLLLREFIEQFWRSLPEMQEALSWSSQMTAAEVGECYSAQLPLDFKAEYPSLTDCYNWLTNSILDPSMHRDRFEYCLRDIIEHLDGRRFRRLTKHSTAPFADVRS